MVSFVGAVFEGRVPDFTMCVAAIAVSAPPDFRYATRSKVFITVRPTVFLVTQYQNLTDRKVGDRPLRCVLL